MLQSSSQKSFLWVGGGEDGILKHRECGEGCSGGKVLFLPTSVLSALHPDRFPGSTETGQTRKSTQNLSLITAEQICRAVVTSTEKH